MCKKRVVFDYFFLLHKTYFRTEINLYMLNIIESQCFKGQTIRVFEIIFDKITTNYY